MIIGIAVTIGTSGRHCGRKCLKLTIKMMVGGTRDGRRKFDEEYKCFNSHFDRTESSPYC